MEEIIAFGSFLDVLESYSQNKAVRILITVTALLHKITKVVEVPVFMI